MDFDMPEHVREIRHRVQQFIEKEIYPVEDLLEDAGEESDAIMRGLMEKAKQEGYGRWGIQRRLEVTGFLFSTMSS